MKDKLKTYAYSFIEDPLKFIRDNLSVFIFFPTLLGGFWQIIQLSDISLSYIRFFSLTQLIPDGLTVLIILLLMSVMGIFFVYIFQKIVVDFLELKNYLDVSINKRFEIVAIIIISVFSIFFTCIIYFIHFSEIIHFFIGVILMLIILIIFVFFNVMFLRGIKLIFFKKIEVPRIADITFMKLRFIYILPFCFYSLLFIIALTKNFRIPRNLVNFERIETLDTTKSVARN